jgi:hypothetical protein
MRRGFLFPVLLFAAACAASKPDIIQVGPWFPARPAEEVRVFSAREETPRPWGAIAIIHSEKFPAENKSALLRQEKLARKLAAGTGADGLIITEETVPSEPGLGGDQAQETYISALAFKYATDISTAAR